MRISLLQRLGSVFFLLLADGDAPPAVAQETARIRAGPEASIGVDRTLPHVEPHLAVNPANPAHLVGAAMVAQDTEEEFRAVRCVALLSFDGGKSWESTDLNGLFDPERLDPRSCFDVWAAIAADGTAYVALLGDPAEGAPEVPSLLFRSPDGGKTWLEPVIVPAGRGGVYDQEDILVDHTDGAHAGTVYHGAVQGYRTAEGIPYTAVSVARSTDGGGSFFDPVPAALSNLELQEMNMVTLSDGTLVVGYHDWGTCQRTPCDHYRLRLPRLWVTVSSDGGRSFSPSRFVAEIRQRTIPKIAVDLGSGDYRDRLYAAWGDWGKTLDPADSVFFNPEKGLYFTRSTDRGLTWARPRRIDRASDPKTLRGTAAVAVSPDGTVGIAWQDRRDDPENRCQKLYFTASLDGGDTFLPEIPVSTAPSCPRAPGNGWTGDRYPTGGEYFGLVGTGAGTFRALWADARSGVFQLYTAEITVSSAGPRGVRR
ncbi:MAG: sialidase family protein [Gemmatimonadota bacterium]